MNTTDAFHLGIGTMLFIGLFSFLLLPPPLTSVTETIQGVTFSVYKILRVVGVVSDTAICSLADQWDIGGLDAVLEDGGMVGCATLTEKKIALLPRERELYGAELGGYVESVVINDKVAVNKLFYVGYLLLGLVAGAVITDIFITIRGKQIIGISGFGYMMLMALAMMMIVARLGVLGPLVKLFAELVPGQLLPDMLFLVMAMSLIWWVVSQIALGYHTTKESYKQFAAVRVAAKADADRGRAALGMAEGRRKR